MPRKRGHIAGCEIASVCLLFPATGEHKPFAQWRDQGIKVSMNLIRLVLFFLALFGVSATSGAAKQELRAIEQTAERFAQAH